MTKSPVFAVYPLTYSRRYAGAPRETVIATTYSACVDDANAASVTCGWATQGGANIYDSQGFCCRCTASGSTWLYYYRGGLQCSPNGHLLADPPASAHCLRFGDSWWYVGYVIGAWTMDFSVDLNVTTTGLDAADTTSQTLRVTPSVPVVRSDNKLVSVNLLGDLASYAEVTSLNGYYLMVPLPTQTTAPSVAFSQSRDTWMVMPPSLVDPSGLTCDKIGVGYTCVGEWRVKRRGGRLILCVRPF